MKIPQKRLGPMQACVFNYIQESIESRGIPPTQSEISKRFNFSLNNARLHLGKICDNGYIELLPGKARGIKVIDRSYKDADPNAGS